jgi:hypothetical protein
MLSATTYLLAGDANDNEELSHLELQKIFEI